MTKKRQLIWWGFVLALPHPPLLAADLVHPIDIAVCEKQACFNQWTKTVAVQEKVSVQAWFDVVDPFKEGVQSIYPLFNVYNNTGADIKVRLGMQLLDSDKTILIDTSQETIFTPFKKEESAYKTYRSITPSKLTAEQIRRAKYVVIIYKRT